MSEKAEYPRVVCHPEQPDPDERYWVFFGQTHGTRLGESALRRLRDAIDEALAQHDRDDRAGAEAVRRALEEVEREGGESS